MIELIDSLGRHFEVFLATLIATSILIAAGLKTMTLIIVNTARERSRREIAAYIAEGSMTPDQGERLLKAEVDGKREVC